MRPPKNKRPAKQPLERASMSELKLSSFATDDELYQLKRELMNEIVRIGKLKRRVATDPTTLIKVVYYHAALKLIWKYIRLDRMPICNEREEGLYRGDGEFITLPEELARYHLPKTSILYVLARRCAEH
jgi:hypothetical protein